jgi:hypothetical protein
MNRPTAPSAPEIERANRQVAQALGRVLSSPPFDTHSSRNTRLNIRFDDTVHGWMSLAAPHIFAGCKEDASATRRTEEPIRQVEEALRHHDEVLSTAIESAGMPQGVLDLMRTWMTVQIEARSLMMQAGVVAGVREELGDMVVRDAGTAPEVTTGRRPMALLGANEMGQALGGMSDQIVRDREKSRELFSVLKAGRKRGREYPAFQAWEGIVGTPLSTVLKALGSLDGAAAYSFFSSRLHELGDLTPVEILSGTPTRPGRISDDAQAILALPADQRLDSVIKAAQAFHADALA